MRIIPAIDLLGGKCVRLQQGNFDQSTMYHDDPVEVAQSFEDHGVQYLHLVDLDGARNGQPVNWRILERIAKTTCLKVDYGGGIKTNEDIDLVFNCGASQVTSGSIAMKERTRFISWLKLYGSSRIILGADIRNGNISIDGWATDTSLPITDYIGSYIQEDILYVVVTDILKDGMSTGPALDYYENILKTFPNIRLIASGGISSLNQIEQLSLMGCEGAIIGKAIYDNTITLKELSQLC